MLDTAQKRAALIAEIQKAGIFCFDSETTGLELGSEIVGLSFALQAHKAYYLALPEDQAATKTLLEEFRPIFEDPEIAKVGQNLKFDLLMLRFYDIKVAGKLWDSMLMHYLLEPDKNIVWIIYRKLTSIIRPFP